MKKSDLLVLLGLSLLLHLVVFWPSPDARIQSSALPTLSVHLPAPEPVEKGASRAQAEKAARWSPENLQIAGTSSKGAMPENRQMAQTSSGGGGAPRHETGRSVGQRAAVRSLETTPRALDVGVAAEPIGTETLIKSGDVSGGSLARYRLAIAAAAVRIQERDARTDALNGVAMVEIRFQAGSQWPQVTLAASSGMEDVDQAAIALLRRAAQLVPLAVAGEVTEGQFRLPVVFERVAM